MKHKLIAADLEPTEHEIAEAMNEVKGFIDITPHDFLKIYHLIHTQAATVFTVSVSAIFYYRFSLGASSCSWWRSSFTRW